jgi:hypothetical protein
LNDVAGISASSMSQQQENARTQNYSGSVPDIVIYFRELDDNQPISSI